MHRQVDGGIAINVGGEQITTTSEHPFFVISKGWTVAAKLRKGDALLTFAGEELEISEVVALAESLTVYNITVAGDHNYFVGRRGYLVHNKPGF